MMFRTVRSVRGSVTCGPLYVDSSTVIFDGSVSSSNFTDVLDAVEDELAENQNDKKVQLRLNIEG